MAKNTIFFCQIQVPNPPTNYLRRCTNHEPCMSTNYSIFLHFIRMTTEMVLDKFLLTAQKIKAFNWKKCVFLTSRIKTQNVWSSISHVIRKRCYMGRAIDIRSFIDIFTKLILFGFWSTKTNTNYMYFKMRYRSTKPIV